MRREAGLGSDGLRRAVFVGDHELRSRLIPHRDRPGVSRGRSQRIAAVFQAERIRAFDPRRVPDDAPLGIFDFDLVSGLREPTFTCRCGHLPTEPRLRHIDTQRSIPVLYLQVPDHGHSVCLPDNAEQHERQNQKSFRG